MSGQPIRIQDILRNHELRLRKVEHGTLGETDQTTSVNVEQEVSKYMNNVVSKVEKYNNTNTRSIEDLSRIVEEQQQRIKSLNELIFLIQHDFLSFKKQLNVKDNVSMTIEERVVEKVISNTSENVAEEVLEESN